MTRVALVDGGRHRRARVPGARDARVLERRGYSIVWLGTQRRIRGAGWCPLPGIPGRVAERERPARQRGSARCLSRRCAWWWRCSRRCVPCASTNRRWCSGRRLRLGPGGVAAWLLRRPLVVHEQNAVAGPPIACWRASRIACSRASRAVSAAGVTRSHNRHPVRPEIARRAAARAALPRRAQGRARLLIFGGSQGAARLNASCGGGSRSCRSPCARS